MMRVPTKLRDWLEAARALVVQLTLRVSPTESQRVFVLTIALGGICGLVAVLFHLAIRAAASAGFDRFGREDGWIWLPWVVLLPAVGAAVAGVLLQRVFPNAGGSGIPQVKTAYWLDASSTRLRDAVGKFVVCVLQIGSGASLGREGPTVQICAGVATSVGRWFALSPANLRRLIPVGSAAGIAAAFNAPIAAVTFTIEEVVGTLDATVLSGVVVAAALAAVVEHSILGVNPLLPVPVSAGLHHGSSLVSYALLGVLAAFVSVAFSDLLLGTRSQFRRTKMPQWLRPALGGLGSGAMAGIAIALVGERGIAGGGYETLARALSGSLALHALGVLCVLKLFATVLSYSSGGAGGIFAPTLFIGAMLGGMVGHADASILGHDTGSELPSFALVGMGAVFAGVIRAPITSILIVFEMTGGYELVLPLMIANTASYVIARRLRPPSIYEALLAQDGIHLPHGTGHRGTLLGLDVSSAMTTQLVTLPASMNLTEASRVARAHGHATYPVLDERGRFIGLLSEARVLRTIAEGGEERTAGEVARRKEYAVPDEPLLRVVARMTRLGVRQLPVLERGTHELLGMVATSDVLKAQVRAAESQDPGAFSSADRLSLEPLAPSAEDVRPAAAPGDADGVRGEVGPDHPERPSAPPDDAPQDPEPRSEPHDDAPPSA